MNNFQVFFRKVEHCSFFLEFSENISILKIKFEIRFKYELSFYSIMTSIKNLKSKFKPRLETYWCVKHNCFHKYKFKGKPSKTWIDCLNENTSNFGGFKKDIKDSEILHLTINKNLRNYSIQSHKRTIGSRKQ